MAPALVENTVGVDGDAQWAKNKNQSDYKEAFQQTADSTNYDIEINGSDTFAPAKYPNCEFKYQNDPSVAITTLLIVINRWTDLPCKRITLLCPCWRRRYLS